MRIVRFISMIMLFVFGQVFSQSHEITSTIYPSKSVFKKYHNDMLFLNNSISEINLLENKFNLLYNNFKLSDSIKLQKCYTELQNSFQNFTDINVRHLIKIDEYLNSNKPVKGSEITYLNKSFQVFKQYNQLYSSVQGKNSEILDKNKKLQFYLLETKLRQLDFFYKNYFQIIGNRRLRRIINADDATYQIDDNDLKKLALDLLHKKSYRSIKKISKQIVSHHNPSISRDTALLKFINNTPYRKSRIHKDRKKIKKYFQQDKTHKIGYFFVHHVSGFIGNFAGLFRFRKGYLFNNDSIQDGIIKRLKPMDIITEKTGFTLTDKMIPGHFGHIAIWLGTEQQLKDIEIWEHSSIKPFHNRIRSGYSILETDRKGTHLKTLQDFINVDEIAIASIIGFSDLPIENKIILYENALAQIGKGYDFNFDVETSNKLVCSELLYQVFGSIHWPTDKYWKRKTISPDNVLSLVLYQNTPISLSYYIGAKGRKEIHLKTDDDLAKNLGFVKKKKQYVLPEKKCKKESKKRCKTIYHQLIYQ